MVASAPSTLPLFSSVLHRFSGAELEPVLTVMLTNMFAALDRPASLENDYVMRGRSCRTHSNSAGVSACSTNTVITPYKSL